jgi:hypothetical protein
MTPRHAWIFGLLSACGSSVTQDPPNDPGMMVDAGGDAAEVVDAGTLVVGRACTLNGNECGSDEYMCHQGAPDGYCSYLCTGDGDCPSGAVCSPVPFSRVTGICMKTCTSVNDCRAGYACAIVELFPGQMNTPKSSTTVCWDDPNAGP